MVFINKNNFGQDNDTKAVRFNFQDGSAAELKFRIRPTDANFAPFLWNIYSPDTKKWTGDFVAAWGFKSMNGDIWGNFPQKYPN